MIGETIGHFKIVSQLGRGGMGEVFAGEHESIQTRVAIKMLLPEISRDTEHVQRFFNEAKIVSKIKHAGIVKIFDVGFFKDHAYLVMELLEGEPLSARIERGRLDWHDAADLGRQIASVLDATHRAGVIHRDLKPDNIFLVPDHELARGERVKVLDFGISKLSGTMAGNSPKTVGTMGTPAYMAPEQWGDSADVDWRADAYSLGCVQFEMLCGRPPFECNTIAEACGKHMHAKPPAPRSFAPDLPAEIDALVLRLLAKDPAERAVSMSQIARELEAIATGKDLASIPERRPASQPSVAVDPGPFTAPSRTVSPPPTMTTLGASAAELEITARGKRPAIIGGLIAGGLVVALVIIALTHTSAKDEHAASDPGSAAGTTGSASPRSASPGSASPGSASAGSASAGSAMTASAGSASAGSAVTASAGSASAGSAVTASAGSASAAATNTGSAVASGAASAGSKPSSHRPKPPPHVGSAITPSPPPQAGSATPPTPPTPPTGTGIGGRI